MLFFKTKTSQVSKIKSLGFTLVEMLVSISIFAIITAVVLIRNNEFNSGILFSNLVYEIALSIREMQTYGITVRASETGTFQFQNGYGVYFDKVKDVTTNTYSFVQFADIKPDANTPPDGLYDQSEKLFKFKLKPGNFIQDIIVCVGSSSCTSVDDVSITYMRPEPNATIKSGSIGTITKATIIIQAPGTDPIVKKCIVITSVGQISVQNHNETSCI
jgi:prepilin-type N-terminal cleavage/methylation domain-containing protein